MAQKPANLATHEEAFALRKRELEYECEKLGRHHGGASTDLRLACLKLGASLGIDARSVFDFSTPVSALVEQANELKRTTPTPLTGDATIVVPYGPSWYRINTPADAVIDRQTSPYRWQFSTQDVSGYYFGYLDFSLLTGYYSAVIGEHPIQPAKLFLNQDPNNPNRVPLAIIPPLPWRDPNILDFQRWIVPMKSFLFRRNQPNDLWIEISDTADEFNYIILNHILVHWMEGPASPF
jgi:hypothetical protein